jgi:signal peptidase I
MIADTRNAVKCELALDVAQTFGEVRLEVTGGSMLPAVWPGDRLIVQRRNPNKIQPGQIILYSRDGGLVAHRVLSRDGDRLVTRGDSLPQADLPVPPNKIAGEIVSIVRRGRCIAPELTLGRRIVSWLLRRSDFSVRVLLHFGRIEWAK